MVVRSCFPRVGVAADKGDDLAAGLADTPRALAVFQGLTVALRRQIVQYVDQAKQARTREKRILLIIKRMLERAAKRRKKPAGKKLRTKKA